ncbi:MAG: hypothetical protein IPG06_21280 [Haliea sp.]|nr:hypothetical protein [Haliea sp.]
MKKVIMVSIFGAAWVLLTGCTGTMQTQNSSSSAGGASTDTRECVKNFKIEGSAISLSGKDYRTHAIVAGVPKAEAMTRASKKLAQDGLNIATMDREGGLLVASNKVIAGRNSQDDAQFVAIFEQVPSGLDVSLKFSSSFGQIASEDAMRENLCAVIAAIEGSR